MSGLTVSGYIARTAGEWFELAQNEYNTILADLGVSQPRYDRAEFSTAVLLIVAQFASEIDNAVASIFDQHDENQASGVILRYLATLAGVVVSGGSSSRSTLTLTAWEQGNVTLTAGEAKASDGTNTWVLLEDVLISAGGSATAVFEAEEEGPVSGLLGTINQRSTGVAGWTSVTNAADATVGSYAESDASIRAKIASGRGGTGSRSQNAIRSALERLPGVQKVRVSYNPKLEDVVVSTRTIPQNGVGVWIYPADLTVAVRQQALALLFAMVGGNVQRSLPTQTGAEGVLGSVLGADNKTHNEGFWYMVQTPLRVDVLIDPATGFESGANLSTVYDPVDAVVRTYFSGLEPGQAVRHDDLIGLVAAVPGVARSTITFSADGDAYSEADREVDAASFALLDATATNQGVTVRTS